MKKGILKKTAPGSSSGRRARWNEDNLEENEVIKSELNPTKIDEPKTPYHPPLDIDVDPDTQMGQYADIEPLDLDDAVSAAALGGVIDGASAVIPEASSKGDFSKQRLKHYDMKAALALGAGHAIKPRKYDTTNQYAWAVGRMCPITAAPLALPGKKLIEGELHDDGDDVEDDALQGQQCVALAVHQSHHDTAPSRESEKQTAHDDKNYKPKAVTVPGEH